jgi:transcriptional regulator with XRE-family HTH domain
VSSDPSASPVAFFAAELKRLRTGAGMKQEELAAAVQYSPSTVAAIETSRMIPSEDFARFADEALHADGALIRLQPLVERMSVRPWFRDLIKVESSATDIKTYESYLIPGLLQTERYAQAIARAARPAMSGDAIERVIAVRRTRQEILEPRDIPIDVEQSPRLWAIIEEPALHRVVGDAEVMREQMAHLVEMSQREAITIQIIPLSQGATCAYGRAFTILAQATGSPVVYLEDVRYAHYVREPGDVAQYSLVFDHLRASALDDARSVGLIEDVRDG